MMIPSFRAALGAVAIFAFAGAAQAKRAPPTDAELAEAHRAIEAACIARGESASACACGVRIAREELDVRVFTLVPEIEPLLDEENPLTALTKLNEALDGAGLSLEDGLAAYQTIRANRARVRRECAPG